MTFASVGIVFSEDDADDVIYGAYQKNSGGLRILTDPDDIRKSEEPISWNAQGPEGPMGLPVILCRT